MSPWWALREALNYHVGCLSKKCGSFLTYRSQPVTQNMQYDCENCERRKKTKTWPVTTWYLLMVMILPPAIDNWFEKIYLKQNQQLTMMPITQVITYSGMAVAALMMVSSMIMMMMMMMNMAVMIRLMMLVVVVMMMKLEKPCFFCFLPPLTIRSFQLFKPMLKFENKKLRTGFLSLAGHLSWTKSFSCKTIWWVREAIL